MTETSDEPEVETTEMDMTIRRTFDAPRERVFEAWTDPEDVMQWWGPEGFTCPVAEIDFREGGTSLVCMRSPDGEDLYNTWTYREIVPNERIEFILNFTDEAGKKLDPAEMGMPPGVPEDVRHVVTFETIADDTSEMTVTEYGYTSKHAVAMSEQGMAQCLDKMAAIVAPDDGGATPIPASGLAAPARRALSDAGYSTLEQLAEVDEATVGELHGMGPSGLETLRVALESRGLSFREVE